MEIGFYRFVAGFALLCMALAAQSPAIARGSGFDVQCVARTSSSEDLRVVAADASRWDCAPPEKPDLKSQRDVLKFKVGPGIETPRYFLMRRGEFARLELALVDAKGRITASRIFTLRDMEPGGTGGSIMAPLPPLSAHTRWVLAAIEQPTNPMMSANSTLSSTDPATDPFTIRSLIVVAAICGMLLLPLVFNFAFYRVLREQFLFWHSAIALAMLLSVSTSSNLAAYLLGMPLNLVSLGATMGFCLVAASAGMFAWSFIEPGKLHPVLRRALVWVSMWAAVLGVVHSAIPFVAREIQFKAYILGFLPVLGVMLCALFDSLRRGSRAAKFQFVAWAPLLLVGIIRMVSHTTDLIPMTDAIYLFYLACALEVVTTAVAVADRFMTIKRQRDNAIAQHGVMEQLAERDALTGLLNRRAVEPRFGQLRDEGFDTLALIDLDKFKSVNDRFGHHIGDRVLQACANSFTSVNDRNMVAVRLGGEEFLILLRGPNAYLRAERLRQAIPVGVARDMDGLDLLVTASMGIIEIPRDGMMNIAFDELYARADKLLYEAKSSGRNRTVREKLTLFEAAPRRATAA